VEALGHERCACSVCWWSVESHYKHNAMMQRFGQGHTNPVYMLPLAQSIAGRLQEQRCLAHARRPIHFRHFSSRISTRDVVAGQAGRGEELVELPEAGRYSAGATRIEALERLRGRDGGQSMSCVARARGQFFCHCARVRYLRSSPVI
jgi:hypothetical protein